MNQTDMILKHLIDNREVWNTKIFVAANANDKNLNA